MIGLLICLIGLIVLLGLVELIAKALESLGKDKYERLRHERVLRSIRTARADGRGWE